MIQLQRLDHLVLTVADIDLCFLTQTPVSQVLEHLQACSVPVVEGPIQRTGTLGPILSVYIRDPDHNLIEIANFIEQYPLPNSIDADSV